MVVVENDMTIICLFWSYDGNNNDDKVGSCYGTWAKCPCGCANGYSLY